MTDDAKRERLRGMGWWQGDAFGEPCWLHRDMARSLTEAEALAWLAAQEKEGEK